MDEMRALYPPWVEELEAATRTAVEGEIDRYAAVRSALGVRPAPERPDALIGMALRVRPQQAISIPPPRSPEDRVIRTFMKDARSVTKAETRKAGKAAQQVALLSPPSPELAEAAKSASDITGLADLAIRALRGGATDGHFMAALGEVKRAIGQSEIAANAIKGAKDKLANGEPARNHLDAAEHAVRDAADDFKSAEAYLNNAAELDPSSVQVRKLLIAQAAGKIMYAARKSGSGPRHLLQVGQAAACLTNAA